MIEILFGQGGSPDDFRYLEINPAFASQTGLHGAVGKPVRELVPDLEASVIDIYVKVAVSGEPIRMVSEVKLLDRWYDVYAVQAWRACEFTGRAPLQQHQRTQKSRTGAAREQRGIERFQPRRGGPRVAHDRVKASSASACACSSVSRARRVRSVISTQKPIERLGAPSCSPTPPGSSKFW